MRIWYALCRWTAQICLRVAYGLTVRGMENIPRRGRVIIASNHRSNLDPPILGSLVPREMHFFAKEELFRNRVLGSLIRSLNAFPVRRGQFDRESLSRSVEVLKNEGALIFFPEGTRAPADGFLKAKLGLGWVVALASSPILPVYIHGSTAKAFRFRGRPQISVTFGKPVPPESLIDPTLRGKTLYQSVSDRVVEVIRDLSLEEPRGRVTSRGSLYDRDIIENEKLR
jgi:1-acyl-sn-glycerol-3-phosphate acyltransferase